ncbi:MAG: DUF2630 family protein [Acidimicrobiales bacterium]|jgi:hypothetical protein
MDDNAVLNRIGKLADEELELEESHAESPLSTEQKQRLKAIEVELDQCWDLLRQRRARRHAGQDPDLAAVRNEEVVEKYLQ